MNARRVQLIQKMRRTKRPARIYSADFGGLIRRSNPHDAFLGDQELYKLYRIKPLSEIFREFS